MIANDLPLGLVVPGHAARSRASPRATPGRRSAASSSSPRCCASRSDNRVGNLVFITADVHYTAAHHYDPARAAVGDFDPFWEFVAGPLNAGAFGPNALDADVRPADGVLESPPAPNTSPADGYQFFGHVAIDGGSRVMTVSLRDLDGDVLFSVDLQPA